MAYSSFKQILNRALEKSSPHENKLLTEARKILSRGYPYREIRDLLMELKRGSLVSTEEEIIDETIESLREEYE